MPRPSTPLLTRETIVGRALEIVDTEGIAGLSMRRLAGDLGARGPSLYHHFAKKDEIIDAIIDQIYNEIRVDEMGPGWEDTLTSYAYQLRALLVAHPHVVELVATRPVTHHSGLRIYEHVYTRLTACGWEGAFGREVILVVENLIFGAALTANAPDIELTPEQRTLYPQLAHLRRQEPRNVPDDGFELGFTTFIDGLRKLIRIEPSGNALARLHPDQGRHDH